MFRKGMKSHSIDCHYGTVHVFDVKYAGKILRFYAGGEYRGYNPHLVDVTITAIDPGVILSNLITLNSRPKYVYVPIEDFKAPKYTEKTWYEIIDSIVDSIPENTIKVGVQCMGGHGRTGTILAIYAGLLKNVPNPVSFIRERYCEKAVETREQIQYIQEITGKYEDVEPAKQIPMALKWYSWYSEDTGYEYTGYTRVESDDPDIIDMCTQCGLYCTVFRTLCSKCGREIYIMEDNGEAVCPSCATNSRDTVGKYSLEDIVLPDCFTGVYGLMGCQR